MKIMRNCVNIEKKNHLSIVFLKNLINRYFSYFKSFNHFFFFLMSLIILKLNQPQNFPLIFKIAKINGNYAKLCNNWKKKKWFFDRTFQKIRFDSVKSFVLVMFASCVFAISRWGRLWTSDGPRHRSLWSLNTSTLIRVSLYSRLSSTAVYPALRLREFPSRHIPSSSYIVARAFYPAILVTRATSRFAISLSYKSTFIFISYF